MQSSLDSQLSHIQQSLKLENEGVQIVVRVTRESGILGPVGPDVVKGSEDPISEVLEKRLTNNERRIKAMDTFSSSSFFSPSNLWELASYTLGLASDTSVRVIRDDIDGARALLNATFVRRGRFKSLYDCCYRERFPEDEACLELSVSRGAKVDREIRHLSSRELVELCRFVVPLLERSAKDNELPKHLIEELAITLQKTINLSRKCRPQLLQGVIEEAKSIRVRLDQHLSEGLSKYSDAIYGLESDVRDWSKQVTDLTEEYKNTKKDESSDISSTSSINIMEELTKAILAFNKPSSTESSGQAQSPEANASSFVANKDIISFAFQKLFGVNVLFGSHDQYERIGKIFQRPKRTGYGDVYGIELLKPIEYFESVHKEETSKIAVKIMKRFKSDERMYQRIVRECRTWSKLKHGKILPLIGLWIGTDHDQGSVSVAFISPWMSGGNLLDFVRQNKDTSSRRRLWFLYNVASALSYMHNHPDGEIVHGDLKAYNVLIGERKAYLCDFSLSYVSDDVEGCTTVTETPWRWQAPELLGNGQKATPEGDVYAFGCVFLEAFTGDIPWPREPCRPGEDAIPDRPSELFDDEHWTLIKSCWKSEPTLRPLSSDLRIAVGNQYSQENNKEKRRLQQRGDDAA